MAKTLLCCMDMVIQIYWIRHIVETVLYLADIRTPLREKTSDTGVLFPLLFPNRRKAKPRFSQQYEVQVLCTKFPDNHFLVTMKSNVLVSHFPDSKVHGANKVHVGPRWVPCWPNRPCYQGWAWSVHLPLHWHQCVYIEYNLVPTPICFRHVITWDYF